ncbi:alpha-ketoglutarate-dependent dioxygenase AlkB [Flavobacterium collinsii]|uniref:Fe2OG dioxygenase domain-containing protein n=1 Tax=Flavobacterium collinsii TaxID=1114861 RepID=A0ABN7ERB9_9FLAO|nr:alpha-ketoglutarate-dependent dioxygenase AlkB [Flavobacterium collinsii]CAA9203421.1 hypothetical protein FLACOL7796_04736 [Flavobacterium collinsii]
MKISELKNLIVLKNNILKDSEVILHHLKHDIIWDCSIMSRKTASFGIPYNYSNIQYKESKIPNFFDELIGFVKLFNGFVPNNCLINFYHDNKSKMGFHSDQIDILYKDTGIAIFSFGSSRILRFKNKIDFNIIYDLLLENNSYFYMSQEVQDEWLHSVLPDITNEKNERYSLTFRKIMF